jgi:hypothetical protein
VVVSNVPAPPPSIDITQPTDGGSVQAKRKVTITAAVTGIVAKVEFYANGGLKCTDTAAPYSCAFQVPASAARSAYTLEARAYNSEGNVVASDTVMVAVIGK